jgi:hypothetical protein
MCCNLSGWVWDLNQTYLSALISYQVVCLHPTITSERELPWSRPWHHPGKSFRTTASNSWGTMTSYWFLIWEVPYELPPTYITCICVCAYDRRDSPAWASILHQPAAASWKIDAQAGELLSNSTVRSRWRRHLATASCRRVARWQRQWEVCELSRSVAIGVDARAEYCWCKAAAPAQQYVVCRAGWS